MMYYILTTNKQHIWNSWFHPRSAPTYGNVLWSISTLCLLKLLLLNENLSLPILISITGQIQSRISSAGQNSCVTPRRKCMRRDYFIVKTLIHLGTLLSIDIRSFVLGIRFFNSVVIESTVHFLIYTKSFCHLIQDADIFWANVPWPSMNSNWHTLWVLVMILT